MNFWDILILAAIAAAVIFALLRIRRGKTGGCSGCCEGCAGCGTKWNRCSSGVRDRGEANSTAGRDPKSVPEKRTDICREG